MTSFQNTIGRRRGLENEGAGKGDTYREVNSAVWRRNYDNIFRKPEDDTVSKPDVPEESTN